MVQVVRAVRDVPSGEELTVSYLGREDFSPVAVRQRILHERWLKALQFVFYTASLTTQKLKCSTKICLLVTAFHFPL